MAKPVAYVGIGTQQTPNIQAPTKIDTPQYPDKGVSYAGYSKTALSNNQYKLNPQEIINYTYSATNKVNVIVSQTIGYPENGKTFYVSSIQIHTSVPALTAGSYIEFNDYLAGVSGNTVYRQELVRSETIHIAFPTPLVFKNSFITGSTPSGLELKYSTGVGGTINAISVNIQGWVE